MLDLFKQHLILSFDYDVSWRTLLNRLGMTDNFICDLY